MTDATYRFRLHLFDVESTYTLRDDQLVIENDNGRSEAIALSDVRSVRLRDGGRFNGVHTYSCVIKTARRKIVIRSAHFAGVGNLECRAEGYRPFILALLNALETHRDSVQFIKGSRVYQVTAITVLALGAIVLPIAGVAILLSPEHPHVFRWFSNVVMFAVFAPAMIGVVRLGSPGTFDPAEVQEEYLPVVEAEQTVLT